MRTSILMAGAAVALVVVAGCGSGASSTTSTTSTSGTSGPAGSGSIHVASTSLGRVLVDGAGRTLYLLTADSPGRSTCDRTCLSLWPPVAPPSTTTLAGISAAVGSATAPDGQKTVTVGGWPLYTYALDHAPGEVTGQGIVSFGGTWYALSADGTPVKAASSPSGSTSSAGGHGY